MDTATKDAENPLKAKFVEYGAAPVLWASSGRPDDREPFLRFSGSWTVASRNSLQRFLAPFVATSSTSGPRVPKTRACSPSAGVGTRRLLQRTSENTPSTHSGE